jgi:predicted membrane metal-binding protein
MSVRPVEAHSLGAVSVDRNAFQLGTGKSVTWVGPIIIILAVVGLLIGIARLINAKMPSGLQTSALVLGLVLAILVGVNYPTEPSGVPSSVAGISVSWSVGVGFWLSLIGSVIVFGGGIVMRSRKLPDPPGEDEDAKLLRGR